MDRSIIIEQCKTLLHGYSTGGLGPCPMPEDAHPDFRNQEERLCYFTLPMSLNYQRDSYKLWQACLRTYQDEETRDVFDIHQSATMNTSSLREKLLKHKIALQPNKHIAIWQTISQTILNQWGSITTMIRSTEQDFLKLRKTIQTDHKKGFPYLSGPKIFNYWSFILIKYGKVNLLNKQEIDIAPDTHITQGSVKLGVITQTEAEQLKREEISARWRTILDGSGIDPIDMHPPLWFWSRSGFAYNPQNHHK